MILICCVTNKEFFLAKMIVGIICRSVELNVSQRQCKGSLDGCPTDRLGNSIPFKVLQSSRGRGGGGLGTTTPFVISAER